jgi:hypothetical protein
MKWDTKGSSINGPSHKASDCTLVCNAHVLISFLATEGAFELQEMVKECAGYQTAHRRYYQHDLCPCDPMFPFAEDKNFCVAA